MTRQLREVGSPPLEACQALRHVRNRSCASPTQGLPASVRRTGQKDWGPGGCQSECLLPDGEGTPLQLNRFDHGCSRVRGGHSIHPCQILLIYVEDRCWDRGTGDTSVLACIPDIRELVSIRREGHDGIATLGEPCIKVNKRRNAFTYLIRHALITIPA
jgi:hypothetical protein